MQGQSAKFRRNNFDVNNTVNVTDPASVIDAIESIFLDLHPSASINPLREAMQHITRLYRGDHPDFAACDTSYHDLQHVLDVTLASARLMDGYERSHKSGKALGKEMFVFGVILALFHDSGYLRKRGQEDDRQGAEFTLIHVSRSAERVNSYMQETGMGELGAIAAQIVHFTGYEVPVDKIKVTSQVFRTIGNLVATGDILAQMSDRCYLEKCHDRLYSEFVLGGIAKKRDVHGREQVVFSSPQDLVIKTPVFYRSAKNRLDKTLQGAYRYEVKHFSGKALYLESVEKNIQFAEYLVAHNADIGMLQRTPPKTPGSDQYLSEDNRRKQQVEDRRQSSGDRRTNSGQRYPDLMEKRSIISDRRKSLS